MYTMYRAFPFVFELRVLLDWACIRTSLDFYQWFKLEDIHGQLFQNQCIISQRRESERQPGEAQPITTKIFVGFLAFAALCTLIWLPLLLFSSGSALMVSNPVSSANLRITLHDGERNFNLYSVTSQKTRPLANKDLALKPWNRQKLLEPYFDTTGSQVFIFPPTSDSLFVSPPPSVAKLVQKLTDKTHNHTVSIMVETTWTRALPLNNKRVVETRSLPIGYQKKGEIAAVIDRVLKSHTSIEASFTINELVPDLMHLPSSTPPKTLGDHSHNVICTFHRQQSAGKQWDSWWEIRYVAPKQAPAMIEVLAVSAQVIGSYMGIGSAISQLGVVGLYISVVFVVGRLMRAFVSNLQSRVMFEDMEDVSQPMNLCKHIYLARQEAGTALENTLETNKWYGELDDAEGSLALVLEEHLYWELIRLYRQPDKLYRYTTLKGHSEVAPEPEAQALMARDAPAEGGGASSQAGAGRGSGAWSMLPESTGRGAQVGCVTACTRPGHTRDIAE
jgi:hypothetical protein